MKIGRNILVFGFGLAVALFPGWFVFPRVLYVQRNQPLEFRHKAHADKSGIAECAECHVVREDGAFAGLPPWRNARAATLNELDRAKPKRPWSTPTSSPGTKLHGAKESTWAQVFAECLA